MPESALTGGCPLYWPINRLVAAYRRGALSPVEVVEQAIARANRFDSSLNAYLTRLDHQAREQAKAAESAYRTGEASPLCGVPISIKDTFPLAGSVTTFGSAVYRDNITSEDSGVVRRLRNAGAVFTGKTNTAEFGAIGADGGGSIRIPAAFTGVFGIKPTTGLCKDENGLRAMSDFISPGPITWRAADARIVLGVLAEREYRRAVVGTKLRVGWCPRPTNSPVDSGVAAVVSRAVAALTDMGHEVIECTLPLDGWNDAFATLVLAEEHRERGHLFDQAAGSLSDYERKSLEAARNIMAADIEKARTVHHAYRKKIAALFKHYDAIVTPTTAVTAFRLNERPTEISGEPVGWLWGAFPFAVPFNVSGHPAASIPCGLQDRLPIGVQLVACHDGEELLLNLAEDLEQALAFDASAVRENWSTTAVGAQEAS
jgi:aspartyl-tRNA(Asn)/glutamyl-tRNA(Gln) amidotransferase subunit A